MPYSGICDLDKEFRKKASPVYGQFHIHFFVLVKFCSLDLPLISVIKKQNFVGRSLSPPKRPTSLNYHFSFSNDN